MTNMTKPEYDPAKPFSSRLRQQAWARQRLTEWMRDTVNLDSCGDREAADAFNILINPDAFIIPDTACVE